MMQMRKKIYAFALVMLLAVGMFLGAPITAHALVAQPIPLGGSITAPGLYDISTTTETTITITVDGVALTGTNVNLTVIINAGKTLTLMNAHITGNTGPGYVGIYAGGANCGLILVGDNSVTGTGPGAGVAVPSTFSIVIEGPGKLTATGGGGAAGIGGSTGVSNGQITIKNAVIIANGTSSGAGIGGGSGNAGNAGAGSNITITNSSVVARGGDAADAPSGGGAGIGGGGGGVGSAGGAGSSITINDSVVQAEGGDGYTTPHNKGTAGGAGIGGGGGGSSGSGVNYAGGAGTNITIDESSSVQANGGNGANGTKGGGGGGAAVGGGGGGVSMAGGTANAISIGNNTLSTGSAPGPGGTGTPPGSDGALCGDGGGDVLGAESGNVKDTGTAIDLTSRPQSSHTGYPAFPSTTNPTDQTVSAGNTASFSVTASGGTGAIYYYQWQASADSGTNWTDIDSTTNTSAATTPLSITNAAAADHGKLYRCIVYDSVFREATSAGASLFVNTSPTITGDTALTLPLGYAGTSTGAYSITGYPAPTVTKTSGNAAITWDDANKKLDIAAGLTAGTYPVVLTAVNGISPNVTLTFTLTVNAIDHSPDPDYTGPSYTQRTLADPATGVAVSGQMANGARLNVRERVLHAEGACAACDEIRARQAAGELIVLYDISVSGGYTGELEVSIPVGEQYNGQTVTILHCKNGEMESVTCTVQNGVAKGTFKKLSPFAVVGSKVGVPENTVVDPPKTGDAPGGMAGIALVLCALGLGVVVRRRRTHRS